MSKIFQCNVLTNWYFAYRMTRWLLWNWPNFVATWPIIISICRNTIKHRQFRQDKTERVSNLLSWLKWSLLFWMTTSIDQRSQLLTFSALPELIHPFIHTSVEITIIRPLTKPRTSVHKILSHYKIDRK